jgi:hypothetical protein
LAIDLQGLLLGAKGYLEILVVQEEAGIAFLVHVRQAQLVLDQTCGSRLVLHGRQSRRRLAELLVGADKLVEGNPTKGSGFVCRIVIL